MQVLYDRCCGLDVHKKSISACLLTPGSGRKPSKESRTFGTTTPELLQLLDWLTSTGCTHVAMESTGPYWKPVYNLLEGSFEIVLANAQHIKAVPGRKTDVRDAEWIGDLLRHGLIQSSFVPAKPLRELRELIRYRKSLVEERTAEANRLQKVLEGANIKLASVASDITGVSGRAMLNALVSGEADVAKIADLAKGRMRNKIAELAPALTGHVGPHQRFMILHQLHHIDFLEELIAQCSAEIASRFRPNQELIDRLSTIPGLSQRTVEGILAEIGWDMERFPTAKHLASWAGICPGNHESAGKRKSGKTRKGSRFLRSLLVEAAKAAGRTRNTYLSAQYHRLASRRGVNKAAIAVAHSILVIIYHLISRGGVYTDLGATYLDYVDRDRVRARLIKRLQALGYDVSLEEKPVPEPAA